MILWRPCTPARKWPRGHKSHVDWAAACGAFQVGRHRRDVEQR